MRRLRLKEHPREYHGTIREMKLNLAQLINLAKFGGRGVNSFTAMVVWVDTEEEQFLLRGTQRVYNPKKILDKEVFIERRRTFSFNKKDEPLVKKLQTRSYFLYKRAVKLDRSILVF